MQSPENENHSPDAGATGWEDVEEMAGKMGEIQFIELEKAEEAGEISYQKAQAEFERLAVLEDPENYGVGEVKVVDGRNSKDAETIYDELSSEDKTKYSLEFIGQRKREIEETHFAEFKAFIDSFDGKLKHARVCPPPRFSPFCLKNTRRPTGEIELDPIFVEEIAYMKEQGVSEINLVASFADKGENGETAMALPDADDYVAMVGKLAERVGAEGLIISIGNETNQSMSSNPNSLEGMGDEVISEQIPPEEYGAFYKEVANKLKEKYPELQFCPAGTAFCAPKYTSEVLAAIGDDSLIDVVDFHPYRNDVDEAWVGDGEEVPGWSYDDYENELLRVTREHGARLIVGEVQFGYQDIGKIKAARERGPEALEQEEIAQAKTARKNLRTALAKSATKGIKSNIWPRVGLPF